MTTHSHIESPKTTPWRWYGILNAVLKYFEPLGMKDEDVTSKSNLLLHSRRCVFLRARNSSVAICHRNRRNPPPLVLASFLHFGH
jgi:hypothetical protein